VRVNWMGYFMDYISYGRLSARMVKALRRQGCETIPLMNDHLDCAPWLLDELGASWENLTISCMEPHAVESVPGRHWYLTMCEGDRVGAANMRRIKRTNVERLILPCEHNRQAFIASGWEGPIDVLTLGTDPDEFLPRPQQGVGRPYTFLAFADRGDRKGWFEVFDAFYLAFGGKTHGERNVRLRVKFIPKSSKMMNILLKLQEGDPRVLYDSSVFADMADLYEQVDCVVLPSHVEGWGMPHREAAMQGLPVITLAYSGMDDGHTKEWSIVVKGHTVHVPPPKPGDASEWMVADLDDLASAMRACFENPEDARRKGARAREWLKAHQTWDHAARNLIALIRREHGLQVGSNAGAEHRQNGGGVYADGVRSRA
jgi:glycosyltransferase involved in cell wall biosynthesis